jgi:hypothetical protein
MSSILFILSFSKMEKILIEYLNSIGNYIDFCIYTYDAKKDSSDNVKKIAEKYKIIVKIKNIF